MISSSMEANNTSAFNYREVIGGGRLSNHAYGRAIDSYTFLNPYINVRSDELFKPFQIC